MLEMIQEQKEVGGKNGLEGIIEQRILSEHHRMFKKKIQEFIKVR